MGRFRLDQVVSDALLIDGLIFDALLYQVAYRQGGSRNREDSGVHLFLIPYSTTNAYHKILHFKLHIVFTTNYCQIMMNC